MMRDWLTVLLAATLLAGCAALQPPPVETPNLYVLEAKPLATAVRAKRDLVLEVAGPHAWPGFDTTQMIYVKRPYELDHFAANQWADTPSRMLAPLLVQALEQTGSFKAVVKAPGVIPADLRVDVELVRLQQNFAARPSRVELALRLQLADVRTKRVLAGITVDESENAPSDDPYGGVIAANAALQRVLQQVADFCVLESRSR